MFTHIDDMHSQEKNARQSRGAVGRLKCRFRHCDFTTNSMILLDRHHDNHTKRALEAERNRMAAMEKAKAKSSHPGQTLQSARNNANVQQRTITIIKAPEDGILDEVSDTSTFFI